MSVEAALARVRGIREQGRRSGALLVVVRGAVALGRLDVAREVADLISAQMMRERAWLAIAEARVASVDFREAMKVLARVTLPGLQAERFWLYQELRHRQQRKQLSWALDRKSAQWDVAVEAPWTNVGMQRPSVATRRGLLCAAFYVGLRHRLPGDAWHFNPAAAEAAGTWVKTDADRQELVRLLALDPEPLEAIHVLGTSGAPSIVDGLLAAYIGHRASELGAIALPSSIIAGIGGEQPTSTDPRSIERALYDEGVALSVRAPERRRVLADAIRACARAALTDPDTWHEEVIAARLRTLMHLGGELARDAIAKPLATLPVRPRFAGAPIAVLAVLDAAAAARIVLARACELGAEVTDRALEIIVRQRGLPPGFARAFARARSRVGAAFLVSLVVTWNGRGAGMVPVLLLESLAARETPPASTAELFADLDGLVERLADQPYVELARRAATERGFLELLQIAAPPRVDAHVVSQAEASWPVLVSAAASTASGVIDLDIVERCAQLLRAPPAVLARGDLVALGARAQLSFSSEDHAYQVQLLDKRRDLLTYLRFADVAIDTCFRSDERSMYVETTRAALLAVWKDPLSFCFRIERGARPIGFSFGNFIEIDGRIGIVLSGIYMRPNRPAARVEVVRAIERGLCAPLGIADIGISTKFASHGELPREYVEQSGVVVESLRALRFRGVLMKHAYDDVARDVNQPLELNHMCWRRG